MLLVDKLALPAFSGFAGAAVAVRPRSGRIRRVLRCRDELLRYPVGVAAACVVPNPLGRHSRASGNPLSCWRHPHPRRHPGAGRDPVARRSLRSEALAAHCYSLRRPRFVRPAAGRARGDLRAQITPCIPQRAPREVAARTSCARGPREKTPARGPPNNSGILPSDSLAIPLARAPFPGDFQGPRSANPPSMAGWRGYIALRWRCRLTCLLVRFATGSRRAPG